jgi:hypothetical protein
MDASIKALPNIPGMRDIIPTIRMNAEQQQ